jgi:hypothetical protein
VFLLSYYLDGKAYDFYTQKVSMNEEEWTLPQFYTELFNYCFPVDYRMQIRRSLARCHQNEKSVTEYTHELLELFNMIGDMSEQDKVIKFWNGSRAIIQKGLWRDNLNPEISTWGQVVTQAEIIEISENVAAGENYKSKGQSSDRSARAVNFDSPKKKFGRGHQHSRTPFYSNRGEAGSAQPSRGSTHQPSTTHNREHSHTPGKTPDRGKSSSSYSSPKPEPR